MRVSCAHASRSLVRTTVIINVHFPALNTIVSTVVSPITDVQGVASAVSAHVSDHDADDENGNEPARTRRQHSLGIPHDRGPSWTSTAIMQSRTPPPRTCLCSTTAIVLMLSSHPGQTRLQCERVRSAWCNPRLRSESTDHIRYRTCAGDTVRRPYPSELTCRGGYLEYR